MKLTRENIYINLQGKSKEELTELWEFLESIGEKQYLSLNKLIFEQRNWNYFIYYSILGRFYQWTVSTKKGSRKEVTIQQLKEILQPMENNLTLTEQLEKAEAEVKRLKEAIEKEKFSNIGNWFLCKKSVNIFKCTEFHLFDIDITKYHKITDQELINKLNKLIK